MAPVLQVRLLPVVTLLHADPSLSEPAPSDGPKRHVSRVELDEGAAMVRTLHPNVFEPNQLLMDHEVIAAMSTGSLTGVSATVKRLSSCLPSLRHRFYQLASLFTSWSLAL
jgi:hypothetical protein